MLKPQFASSALYKFILSFKLFLKQLILCLEKMLIQDIIQLWRSQVTYF